jgi:polar amino acid transport system substrate-binding protein
MKFAFLIEPPFCFRDARGKVTGCDIAVAHHLVEAKGLGALHFVETEFSHLLPGLADGYWDMTTGLFVTSERQKAALFSRPIWALADGLLINQEAVTAIIGYRSLADSMHFKLAVVRDQVQHANATALGVSSLRIVVFETYGQAAEAVLTRAVDAFASVAKAHYNYVARYPGKALAVAPIAESELRPQFGAFAYPLGREAMRDSIDVILERYLGSSEHRALMRSYSFSDADVDLVVRKAA